MKGCSSEIFRECVFEKIHKLPFGVWRQCFEKLHDKVSRPKNISQTACRSTLAVVVYLHNIVIEFVMQTKVGKETVMDATVLSLAICTVNLSAALFLCGVFFTSESRYNPQVNFRPP
jgi:hypothetical protein